MDEFHSFADPERGIVWELSLSLLPKQARLHAAIGDRRQLRLEFLNGSNAAISASSNSSRARSAKVPLTTCGSRSVS